MAAIYQWFESPIFLLTSPPYPIEQINYVNIGATWVSGYSQGVNTESVTFTISHLASALDNVVIESAIQPEAVEFTISHLDSELKDILLDSDPQVESVEFTISHLDSTLDLALVSHTNPAESIDISATWLSGTST